MTFLGTSAEKPTKEMNFSTLAPKLEQDNKSYLFVHKCTYTQKNWEKRQRKSTSET
ncbi:hypothetical protein ACM66Z_04345 [Sulfurovum sp. ST-21]|uniref:Uncharacterized protein n=1 Tax=Sulfurovum indicum TaxID=2779528 RepID=A0A7M1S6U5_9BACT|nr:hypothetical protein [Sulfurovum indicum]QOR62701.1 hypothetical protein IMZ28_04320 [Sulfurovum indicum]